MNYLYGDASPAPLTVNYIELLRDALEFGVEVLLANQQMRVLSKQELELRGAADAEVKRIEELATLVARAMEGAPAGEATTARCAQAIVLGASEQVRVAVAGVRAELEIEAARLGALDKIERDRTLKALERLLLKNDLPDTSFSMLLEQQGGTGYGGCVATSAGCGVDAVLELEFPASNVFSQVTRVEQFVTGLEVHAPESGGFFRKEGKIKPQRLDRMHLVELSLGNGDGFKLRMSPNGTGGGFDVTIGESQDLLVAYVNEKGEAGTPSEPSPADVSSYRALFERLVAAGNDLRLCRKRLLEAKLDDETFVEHEDPAVLVERLVEEMAPVVQEIARRSKSTEELIIKRVTGDKRREEIFSSKAELLQLLDPLSPQLRELFKPLGLDEQKPSTRPAPIAKPLPSRRPPPIPPRPADEPIDGEPDPAEGWDPAEPLPLSERAATSTSPRKPS